MKLLVFAHVPPPHHGQSYMVKLMLDGFGGDCRKLTPAEREKLPIQCFHVDARVSDNIGDVGVIRFAKLFSLFRFCLEAIWCRFRHGVTTFYYVPAPGKSAALYRDWIVMLMCRPFFKDVIHHWHAVGLGDWLSRNASWIQRWITHKVLGRPSLGLALAIPSMRDALWFRSRNVELVPNGIPDPCPQFNSTIQPRREARRIARVALLAGEQIPDSVQSHDTLDLNQFHVLFLGNLLRDKGVFDAMEAVSKANSLLERQNQPIRLNLTIAGAIPSGPEEKELHQALSRPDLAQCVTWIGFANAKRKSDLLRESDCLCFPSYYHAESFGLVVVEAMAAGLPIVTTRWRALPDLLPAGYLGIVPPRDSDAIATALIQAMTENASSLRDRFLQHFNETAHIRRMKDAILAMGPTPAIADRAG